jgi:basic amino acid/polyamine antiporter, APA family
LLSLLVQGVLCYLFEYFAAGYLLNPGYPATKAAGSGAPVGDMMVIVGTWLFGSAQAGWWFMIIEALTVFLALIGTTLSCMNTGARVTYAMGRDDELASHFGLLHGKNLTPHRAIWALSMVSMVVGIVTVLFYLCGPSATAALDTALTDSQKTSIWYPSFLQFSSATAASLPNSLLVVTLTSNFGTFMLYMLTCFIAIVAYREHNPCNSFKHMVIPVFGLLANLLCMMFYLVGPFVVTGMSKVEPFVALGVAGVWGAYGAWYFLASSKSKNRSVIVSPEMHVAATGR